MTISSETTKSGPYTGNGSTDVFAYNFLVYDQADLEVVLTVSATGVETVQTIGAHYSVSGVGTSGGNVTMGTPPTSAQTLTIRRKQELTQGTDLTNQGAYVGETHERVFDETIQKIQQVNEVVGRAIKIGVSQSTAGIDFTLPPPSANKVIGVWNADGDAIVAGPTASSISNAETLAASASASALTAENEASASAPKYSFSTSTSVGDPGAGVARLNNSAAASATILILDDQTADTGNPDVEAWLLTFDDSTNTIKGWIRLVEVGTPQNYVIYNVTGVTNSSGFVQVAVAHVDSNFASGTTFGASAGLRLFFSRSGDAGATGATGTGATVAVGTVTTGAAGSSATITNSGSSTAATFNFTIPRGDTGAGGGGPGVDGTGTDEFIRMNATTVTGTVTIPANRNAFSAGPIEIPDGSGNEVIISSGSVWHIIGS